MSERIEEIRASYNCVNTFENEAGKREFTTEELKKVVSSQKNINDSIPYLLKELEEAQQRSAKWEKAFDNADKQYLKMEHEAAELRRQLASKAEKLEKAQKEAGLAHAAFEGLQDKCVSRGEYDSLLNKHSTLAKSHREAQQTIVQLQRADKGSKWVVVDNNEGLRFEGSYEEALADYEAALEEAKEFVADNDSYGEEYIILAKTGKEAHTELIPNDEKQGYDAVWIEGE